MIPTANLVTFMVAATVLIAIPGPSVLFVIGRALSIGRVGALFSVLGNQVGVLVQAAAISLGLGASRLHREAGGARFSKGCSSA